MRGDNVSTGNRNRCASGSPPHAWGQCFHWKQKPLCLRFTPTCVGTMEQPLWRKQTASVHPHMRGDNLQRFVSTAFQVGSPPHAWGQSQNLRTYFIFIRFTPTCVGTIVYEADPPGWGTVHPHMRGDNEQGSGSGKRLKRFTPTCVGTIGVVESPEAVPSVHPHMRGDNRSDSRWSWTCSGSPPHAWGQFLRLIQTDKYIRFTPTCVGTMQNMQFIYCSPPVHPHMRGDNLSILRHYFSDSGSPPHAWGQ